MAMYNSKKMTYFRALQVPWRAAPLINVGISIINIVRTAIIPLTIAVTARFVDTSIYVFENNRAYSAIVPPLLWLSLLTLYWYIISPLLSMLYVRRGQRYWLYVDHKLMADKATLEYKHFESKETVNLMNRVWNNPSAQLTGVWDNFVETLVSAGRIVSCMYIIFVNTPISGVLLLVSALPLAFRAFVMGKRNYNASKDLTEGWRKVGGYVDYINNRNVVHERNLFGFSAHLNRLYNNLYNQLQQKEHRILMKSQFYLNLNVLAMMGLSSMALLFFIPDLAAENISPGLFIALIGALSVAAAEISNMFDFSFTFSQNREYLREFKAYQDLTRNEQIIVPMSADVPRFEQLEFRDVTFSYPSREGAVLKHCSFTIKAGQSCALVGANGSGKTTIVKLIMRLYDEYEGQILLNGKDLRSWDMKDIKAIFYALFQGFERYNLSVFDNISVGVGFRSGAREVEEAAQSAVLSDIVERLPNGLGTMMGKVHDGGFELSDGEWQRVAVARTFVSSAQVKILDEPTASLDPMAEKELYDNFNNIKQIKETAKLLISHRLASAKNADTIFVLDDGYVVEQGDHAALMAKGHLYAEMYNSQRKWYV
jgi:ABC-type multidrug transport system fused ATPase/permease subunit